MDEFLTAMALAMNPELERQLKIKQLTELIKEEPTAKALLMKHVESEPCDTCPSAEDCPLLLVYNELKKDDELKKDIN